MNSIFTEKSMPLAPNAPLFSHELASEILVDFDISECVSCGFIYNTEFKPEHMEKIYAGSYSSGIPFSPKVLEKYNYIINNAFASIDLKGKTICEIGASDFTFSNLMLKEGCKEVAAFEPSNFFNPENANITHIKKLFTAEAYFDSIKDKSDLVIIRHVLEHVYDPLEILSSIDKILKPGGYVYIEVPNTSNILEDKRFYDFFYEHVGYYTPAFLTSLMKNFKYKAETTISLANHQHFGVLFSKASDAAIEKNSFLRGSQNFNGDLSSIINEIKDVQKVTTKSLNDLILKYKKVGLYGAGNHGINVSCLMSFPEHANVKFLDLNPLKSSKFSPKSHIEIITPTKSIIDSMDVIIITAALHQDEIYLDLREKFEYSKKVFGIYPEFRELN